MPERRIKPTWTFAAILVLAVGAVLWLLTQSAVWLGVGVAFAVMFFVVASTSTDDR